MSIIQRASAADIPTIRELAHCIWWAHYPEIISTEQIEYMLGLMYSEEALTRQLQQEGHQIWLVNAESIPVGFLSVSETAEGQYFLHKFYLEASTQGKGLGTAIFNELQTQYPDMRTLRLNVNRQNFKSINFYFKLGFCIEKCVDIPIGQGFVMDDFQMLWHKK
ncbi:MAG: GNAT family N-acetyltransferase [Lewinellaceae bacterium]|nr:GNAT family N-acetyltransferase [Saprospiraceae bacterium]MCB9316855.1 GNAT family N-acetyltransferase [Lewinellaceae bacterium]MCB9332125.1 GNAT family N-acetyltransferase [Lewinellaceae bacterium]